MAVPPAPHTPDDLPLETTDRYAARTRALGTALVLVLPLLVIYEVGLVTLDPPTRNGVGVVFRWLIEPFGPVEPLLGAILLVATALTAFVWARRPDAIAALDLPLMIVESLLYAAALMAFALVFTLALEQASPALAQVPTATPPPPPDGPHLRADLAVAARLLTLLVLAAGAGVYEELLFRLFLVTALIWAFTRGLRMRTEDGRPSAVALLLAVLVSSLLFAAAHHLAGEPWALTPMVIRTVLGFGFGVLFVLRGFAVAVYTHTFYDVFALLYAGPLLEAAR